MSFIKTAAAQAAHYLSKNAPTILTVAGIAGGVTAAVLGTKAALKSQDSVANLKTESVDCRSMNKKGAYVSKQEYVEQLTFIYVTHGKAIVKNYAPALAVGAVSIGAVLWGHGILRSRNAALLTAYATLERSFAAYRKQVKQAAGPNAEKIEREISQGVSVDEEGQLQLDNTKAHLYTRVFDEINVNWSVEQDYNRFWIAQKEKTFNERLQNKGHVFLNEVLDALGFEHTTEGSIVGWLKDGDGDGYIDFNVGAMDTDEEAFRQFLDGRLLLEFNVDGMIYTKI